VFGPVLETAYGQVEAPQVVTVMRAAEFEDARNIGSVGRPTFMTEVAILGPSARRLPAGEVGEIGVRGDLVMSGYLDQPDLTAQALVDGWLRTGDLGTLDERGYLFLKGRTREVINTGGFKVYPAEVESALARHPAVRECCVYGADDPRWGEAVHAAVVAGDKVTESELIAFVKRELDSVKAPKAVHFVDTLPRNAAGKVVRGAVRDLVRDGGR
jgi:acyl-CoA synthetase (AMP-forming)/AMP-acid ligase II